MILLYIFGIGVVIGFIKYLLIPALEAAKHGWIDGWNGTTQYKSLYFTDYNDTEKDDKNQAIEDEITHLESIIDRYNEMAMIVENELRYCNNDKRRMILLNKLNTLDNNTFKTKQKIDKLLEKLE